MTSLMPAFKGCFRHVAMSRGDRLGEPLAVEIADLKADVFLSWRDMTYIDI